MVSWVIAGLLALIAFELAVQDSPRWSVREAWAQYGGQAGARGVYAFTGQLDKNTYGLFMMDVDAGTIWCYEFTGNRPDERSLRLVAGRSWLYDRYLENFGLDKDGLSPEDVAAYVEDLRRQKLSTDKRAGNEPVGEEMDSGLPPGARND